MTLDIMTVSITTLSITLQQSNAYLAKLRIIIPSIIQLNAIMMSVMLGVQCYKTFFSRNLKCS